MNSNSSNGSYKPTTDIPSHFKRIFIVTLYSIIFIVGFIGNGLLVCVLVKNHQKFKMITMCLFNLAVSDLLFLFSLPFWAHSFNTNSWPFGVGMYHVVTVLFELGFYGGIFFMVLMTIDRYVTIVHVQSFLSSKHWSCRAGLALALLMWTLSLVASLPTIMSTQVNNETALQQNNEENSTNWRQFSYIQRNILGWVLPMSVMVFCYSHIIPILKSMKSKKKHKAVKLILFIIIIFFIFWTPYNIVIFMYFLQEKKGYWNHNHIMTAMDYMETLAFSHCCLNPIIYAFVGQKFRNSVIKMLRDWFPICFPKGSHSDMRGEGTGFSQFSTIRPTKRGQESIVCRDSIKITPLLN